MNDEDKVEIRMVGVILLIVIGLGLGIWAYNGFQSFLSCLIGSFVCVFLLLTFAFISFIGVFSIILIFLYSLFSVIMVIVDIYYWFRGFFYKKGDENVPVHCP